MDAGLNGTSEPVTVMRFRFDDGGPYPQTIDLNDVPTTASDWKLMPQQTASTTEHGLTHFMASPLTPKYDIGGSVCIRSTGIPRVKNHFCTAA